MGPTTVSRRLTLAGLCILGVTLITTGFPNPANALPRHRLSASQSDIRRLVRRTTSSHAISRAPVGAVATTSTSVLGIGNFQVGYDYTQYSHLPADAGGDASAVASAQRLLTSTNTFQNVALMGWGANDPEPSPGAFGWDSLDSRVNVMGATVPENQRMITLCTAPGWMKVGGESQEWNMDAAVAPSYFQAFAALAAQVAERYDGAHRAADGQLLPRVDFFDVWNEMKGFWNTAANTWDYQGYTTMYNDVYAAIKAVRPDAQIGGPYAPVGAGTAADVNNPSSVQGGFGVVDQRALDVMTYWLQHKVGAQFVSMDGGPAITNESGFASGQYFAAVAHWLRELDNVIYPGAATLPLVWAEFYPGLQSMSGQATGKEAVAIDMSNIIQAGTAGVNNMLIWEMEGTSTGANSLTGEGVWTDTANAGGGKPTSFYDALDELHNAFPPGTAIYSVTATGPISTLASKTSLLLVSQSPRAMTVYVRTTSAHRTKAVVLSPYQVSVVKQPIPRRAVTHRKAAGL
jgi:hypothetical protein